jgi:hypothetical protein
LNQLIQNYLVLAVGVAYRVYVAHEFRQHWVIESFKNQKGRGQLYKDLEEEEEEEKIEEPEDLEEPEKTEEGGSNCDLNEENVKETNKIKTRSSSTQKSQ